MVMNVFYNVFFNNRKISSTLYSRLAILAMAMRKTPVMWYKLKCQWNINNLACNIHEELCWLLSKWRTVLTLNHMYERKGNTFHISYIHRLKLSVHQFIHTLFYSCAKTIADCWLLLNIFFLRYHACWWSWIGSAVEEKKSQHRPHYTSRYATRWLKHFCLVFWFVAFGMYQLLSNNGLNNIMMSIH